MKKGVYFVSGIDTNIGKSYATGALAKRLSDNGEKVITQKMIQTGNVGRSEDIELHRRIMGIGLTDEDKAGLTFPVVFSYPASPHLAAALDGKAVDTGVITRATDELRKKYDIVLLEGAGGLMVPASDSELTIDYVKKLGYPVILVTSGRLGSINHTLLSLEALYIRDMPLHAVIYNLSPETDRIIADDTIKVIQAYMRQYFPEASFETQPHIEL